MIENHSSIGSNDRATAIGKGAILLIDDEQLIRDSTKRLLERLGYTVHIAVDGADAIDVYAKIKDDVELILLDMMMPGMSGVEVFQKLRQINEKARIILSSGYSRDERAEEIINLGAVGFLEKPFELQTLIDELSRFRNTPDA